MTREPLVQHHNEVVNSLVFHARAAEMGLELSSEMVSQFQTFEEALYDWNSRMNLTRVPREECWVRHFLDSLLIAEFCLPSSSVLDIGTGPGFPAWPLAVARPDLSVTALDSSGKMLGFLRSQPVPNLTVVQARAEEWDQREKFDIVTGRALAQLSIQMEVSAAFCRLGGFCIPMRTEGDREAVASLKVSQLGLSLKSVEERTLPVLDAVRLFPIYEKTKHTPTHYPRPWAEIKKGGRIGRSGSR